MKTSHRGTTLIEAILSLTLLNLLMAFMFFVYRLGASAWQSGQADTQLAQTVQSVVDRISREASRSSIESLSFEPQAPDVASIIAFLSPIDQTTNSPSYDPVTLLPLWHSHFVCYYDQGNKELRWKKVPVALPSIEATPLNSLNSQRSDGALLAEEISACEFFVIGDSLDLTITAERQRYGSSKPDQIKLHSTVFFRN